MTSPAPSTARNPSAALTPEDLSNISAANLYTDSGMGDRRLSDGHHHSPSHMHTVVTEDHIRDAKPEPESSFDKSIDTASSFEDQLEEEKSRDYEGLLAKFKNQRNIFYTLIIGLSVALVGCLLGLILVKVLPRSDTVFISTPANSGDPIDGASTISAQKEIVDPFRIHRFPSVSAQDSDIAQVFADHSMYQTFYGVTYDGPEPSYYPFNEGMDTNNNELSTLTKRNIEGEYNGSVSVESSYEIQHQVSIDLALLSRVTKNVRIVHRSPTMLAERVIQALHELNLNLKLYLSVNAARWAEDEYNVRELINSAPANTFAAIYIERDSDESAVHAAHSEMAALLRRRKLDGSVKLSIVEPQYAQPNPLELSENADVAVEFINSDRTRRVYTNLDTPSETSEKAKYMTNWVCRVVPSLRNDIEWFWANAFDDGRDIKNGVFSKSREMKPAGLPRCAAHRTGSS